VSCSKLEVSCSELEAPGSEVEIPSFEAGVPCSEVEISSFKVDASSSEVGIPGFEVGRRGLKGDRPLFYRLCSTLLKGYWGATDLATTIAGYRRCISEYLPMQCHRE
jgi:hypothetical protein